MAALPKDKQDLDFCPVCHETHESWTLKDVKMHIMDTKECCLNLSPYLHMFGKADRLDLTDMHDWLLFDDQRQPSSKNVSQPVSVELEFGDSSSAPRECRSRSPRR